MNKTIVFVDDDFDDLALYKEMVDVMGFPNPVICFSESLKAFQHVIDHPATIALIITDINMPVLTGFQLRKKLMASWEPFDKIPFILLSTSQSESEELLARQLSIAGFFKKEPTLSGMKEMIEQIMAFLPR